MMVKDPREPSGWRDEGPSGARIVINDGGVTAGFEPSPAFAEGRCPLCGIKMTKGNQGSCIKTSAPGFGSKGKRRRGKPVVSYGQDVETGRYF